MIQLKYKIIVNTSLVLTLYQSQGLIFYTSLFNLHNNLWVKSYYLSEKALDLGKLNNLVMAVQLISNRGGHLHIGLAPKLMNLKNSGKVGTLDIYRYLQMQGIFPLEEFQRLSTQNGNSKVMVPAISPSPLTSPSLTQLTAFLAVSKGYITFFHYSPSILYSKISETQHYWHLGLNNSLCWGTVLGITSCLVGSWPLPLQQFPSSLPLTSSSEKYKYLQALLKVPLRIKLPRRASH